MVIRAHLCLILAATLAAGCTQFPELDRTLTPELESQDYPALVPLDPLLANAKAGQVDPDDTTSALQVRVARLRAKAARLRGSVLSGHARQRLAQGLH